MRLIPPHAFEVSPWSDHTPCTPSRCYCGAAMSPNVSTMPKVALAVNVPSHAQSSHSSEGMAQASLDEDDAWEDDFQNLHTPVHCVVHREDNGHRGSPGQRTEYQVDIGMEEDMLEPSTLPGEPPSGFSWQSRASRMTRCPGMNLSPL